MTYQLLVFDFDGTLADSRMSVANSVNHALAATRRNPIPNGQIFPTIGKVPIQSVFSQFHPDLTEENIAELTRLFRAYITENALHDLQLFPGVEETLRALKSHGKTLAILTTKHTSVISKITASLGIDSLFAVQYGSGLPGGNKPEKGCMEYIWQHVQSPIAPAQTVMIGDTSVDLQTAKNAGVDAIGVTYGIDGKLVHEAGFTHIIDKFSELLEFK